MLKQPGNNSFLDSSTRANKGIQMANIVNGERVYIENYTAYVVADSESEAVAKFNSAFARELDSEPPVSTLTDLSPNDLCDGHCGIRVIR
jgi:hypothetical protein